MEACSGWTPLLLAAGVPAPPGFDALLGVRVERGELNSCCS